MIDIATYQSYKTWHTSKHIILSYPNYLFTRFHTDLYLLAFQIEDTEVK